MNIPWDEYQCGEDKYGQVQKLESTAKELHNFTKTCRKSITSG